MQKIEIADFKRGLNTNDAAHAIEPDQAAELLNVDVRRKGRVFTRNGKTSLHPGSALPGTRVNGATYFKNASLHICAVTTFIYKIVEGTATSVLGNLTSGAQVHFATWNAKLWIANGAETPSYFNGISTWANPATPPAEWTTVKPNYICEHENRLWTLTAASSQLHWCALDNAEDWTTADNAGSHQFAPNDGWGGVGIVSQKSGLVVFKNYSIYKVTGKTPVSFQFPNLYNDIGCCAPRSIVNIENKIFFLSRNKGEYIVYILDDSGTLTPISQDIAPTLAAITTNVAAAVSYKGKYILSFFTTGSTYKTVSYNYRTNSWEHGSGDACSCYYTVDDALYGGRPAIDGNTPSVYTVDTGTNDADTAITSYVKTRNYLLEGADYTKQLRYLIVWVKASGAWNMDINIYIDDKADTTTLKVPLGPRYTGETTKREVIPINVDTQGNMIAIKFGTSTINQPFELYRAELYYDIAQPEIR